MAILNANEKKTLKYHFYAEKLGESNISSYISVVGSTTAPLQIKFHFIGIGPKLKLTLKQQETPRDNEDMLNEINFGNIVALKQHSKILLIENICPIEASIHAEINKTNSSYTIDVDDAIIKPNETLPITINVFLNDTIKVNDDLMMTVLDGDDIIVSLLSRGIGTTLVPSIDMKTIDFENKFTNNKCSKSFRIENRGRRAQTIMWNYVKRKEEIIEVEDQNENEDTSNMDAINNDTESEMSIGGKSFASIGSTATMVMGGLSNKYKSNLLDEDEDENCVPSIFKITPNKITLQPNTAVDFKISAKSGEQGVIKEIWECGVLIGKARKPINVFKPEIKCNFLKPLIEFSNKKVYFEYLYEENVLIKPLTKQLKLKNVSLLPLVFMIKCAIPFSVDRLEYTLNPNQETTLNVQFDPGMKTDRLCYKPKARLSVIYRDHPQRDKIPLYAECWFPNLQFPSTNINFGCILNQTKCIKQVTVKNISKVDVKFAWIFLQDEFENDIDPNTVPLEKRHFWVQNNFKKNKERGEKRNSIIQMKTNEFNMNNLFDIRPLHGIIKPHESVEMTFVFNGEPNIKAFGTALCEIIGGPDYYIKMNAATNDIDYNMSTQNIDFGKTIMGQTVSHEIIISNTSSVPFEFYIDTNLLKYKEFIQINPINGTISGYSKQKISIKCTPLLPIQYKEEFNIQIAHFMPKTITLNVNAYCSEIIVDLPRDIPSEINQNEEYTNLLTIANANIKQHLQIMHDMHQQQQQQQALETEQKDASENLEDNTDSKVEESKELEEEQEQEDIKNDDNIITDIGEEKTEEKEDKILTLEIDSNYVNIEIDKLQYIDVLTHLLSNYWNQNKQKSKRIAFSNKDLRIAYDKSNLITLLHSINSNTNSNEDKINNIQCNFNIYQYRSVGSTRY
eukprot:415761_1